MQKNKINNFRLRCLRCIFKFRWQQKISNEEVLGRTGCINLNQHRLRWLGHIMRMGDEQITKSMLYIELVGGRR